MPSGWRNFNQQSATTLIWNYVLSSFCFTSCVESSSLYLWKNDVVVLHFSARGSKCRSRKQFLLLHLFYAPNLRRNIWCRDGSVGIKQDYRLDYVVLDYRQGQECFTSPKLPARLWGSPSFLFNGFSEALSPEKQQPVCEVDLSSVSTVEVRNEWKYNYESFWPS